VEKEYDYLNPPPEGIPADPLPAWKQEGEADDTEKWDWSDTPPNPTEGRAE